MRRTLDPVVEAKVDHILDGEYVAPEPFDVLADGIEAVRRVMMSDLGPSLPEQQRADLWRFAGECFQLLERA